MEPRDLFPERRPDYRCGNRGLEMEGLENHPHREGPVLKRDARRRLSVEKPGSALDHGAGVAAGLVPEPYSASDPRFLGRWGLAVSAGNPEAGDIK